MKKPTQLTGRNCYGHLGGKLGALLFKRMMEENWIKLAEDRSTVYELTNVGREKLNELGISLEDNK